MAIQKGYKMTASTIFDLWSWNKTYRETECCKENNN